MLWIQGPSLRGAGALGAPKRARGSPTGASTIFRIKPHDVRYMFFCAEGDSHPAASLRGFPLRGLGAARRRKSLSSAIHQHAYLAISPSLWGKLHDISQRAFSGMLREVIKCDVHIFVSKKIKMEIHMDFYKMSI